MADATAPSAAFAQATRTCEPGFGVTFVLHDLPPSPPFRVSLTGDARRPSSYTSTLNADPIGVPATPPAIMTVGVSTKSTTADGRGVVIDRVMLDLDFCGHDGVEIEGSPDRELLCLGGEALTSWLGDAIATAPAAMAAARTAVVGTAWRPNANRRNVRWTIRLPFNIKITFSA